MTNHLGADAQSNVLATMNHRAKYENGQRAAEVLSGTDYFPFGKQIAGRSFSSGDYRFGFNGKENDTDFGDGVQDYGARIYNSEIGRWLSSDPMEGAMPSMSPYAFALNNPIVLKDAEGELPIIPLLLKAGAAGGVELMLQLSMNYFFDDKVETFDQALKSVDWKEVGWAAAEGAIPWKVPGGRLGKAGAEGIKQVIKNFTKSQIDGTEYTSEMAMRDFVVATLSDLAGEGLEAAYKRFGKGKVDKFLANIGVTGNSKNKAGSLIDCACFVAGTQVLTDSGYVEIQEIEVGDLVWAYNEATGQLELKQVAETFIIHEKEGTYHLFVGEEEIVATGSHPFFIGGKWIEVKDLSVGDSVQLYSGAKKAIDRITFEDGEFTVYNFTVQDYHNYYVSYSNVLVHNCGGFSTGTRLSVVKNLKGGSVSNNHLKNRLDVSINGGKIDFDGKASGVDYAFVITEKGDLRISKLYQGAHFDLSDGADFVQAAGTISFNKDGSINKIINSSGHYTPSRSNNGAAIKAFYDRDLIDDEAYFRGDVDGGLDFPSSY